MKRRILSILLTLCMVLCLAPAVAFAEEATTPVTNIDAIIDEPSEGEHPADNPSVTATPKDSVEFVSASWKRIPQEKYNDDKAKTEDNTKSPQTADNTKSPQTGDESPVTLWLALLFLGGGALVGTGIVSKKRANRN